MLVAAPYSEFDVGNKQGPPRIISEVKKKDIIFATPNVRPKLSGDLLVRCGPEKKWWPRRVAIRGGQLHVSAAQGDGAPTSLRLPLRHLSLQAGHLPNSLSLCRNHSIILTLQAANERQFDIWVKAIAIELIRQTPLYDVKYLDILSLAGCLKQHKHHHYEKDWNFNYIPNSDCNTNPTKGCEPNGDFTSLPATTRNLPASIDYDTVDCPRAAEGGDNVDVEDLLKRCQSTENYVPVKQKLVLFESLCRLGRKVRSTEDVSYKVDVGTKRARSLHDLSSLHTHIAVREICKYFEKKNDDGDGSHLTSMGRTIPILNNNNTAGTTKRAVHSDSHVQGLNHMKNVVILT